MKKRQQIKKKKLTTGCLLVTFLGLIFSLNCYANERAMWVWAMGPKIVLEPNGNERADFFSFVAAPHGDPSSAISTVFMHFDTNISDGMCVEDGSQCNLQYTEKVREFVADAHSRGLKVQVLFGDIRSALSSPHNKPANRLLRAVLNYNRKSEVQERFDGIQFDVEPYLLGENDPLSWEKDMDEIWKQYIQNIASWQAEVDTYNQQNNEDMKFGVAIPFWLEPTASRPMLDHRQIQDMVDYIAVMAYDIRVNEEGKPNVLGLIKDELAYARDPDGDGTFDDAKSNSVYVGLETIEVNWKERISSSFFRSLYPHSTSFHTQNNDILKSIERSIKDDYKNSSEPIKHYQSFAGIALHFYEDLANSETAYRALKSENSNHAPVCSISFPSGKEMIAAGTKLPITYQATDPDGDELLIHIYISDDSGETWTGLPSFDADGDRMDKNDGVYAFDSSTYPAGDRYRIQIQVFEKTAQKLMNVDTSDFSFQIVKSVKDKQGPIVQGMTINGDSMIQNSTKMLRINWTPAQDESGVKRLLLLTFGCIQSTRCTIHKGFNRISKEQYTWAGTHLHLGGGLCGKPVEGCKGIHPALSGL